MQALRKLGVPESQIEQAQPRPAAPSDEPALCLWAWLQPALDVLSRMRTQWRVVGTPWGLHREGLDYGALPPVLQALGLVLSRELLDQLQVLEQEAARLLNDQSTIG